MSWPAFAYEPNNTEAAVCQKRFELSYLVLAGLLHLKDSIVYASSMAPRSNAELAAFTMLSKFDRQTDLQVLSEILVRAPAASGGFYCAKAAAAVNEELCKFRDGGEISEETISGLADPFPVETLASQVAKTEMQSQSGTKDKDASAAQGAKKRKKTAAKDFALTESMLQEFPLIILPALKFMLKSKQADAWPVQKPPGGFQVEGLWRFVGRGPQIHRHFDHSQAKRIKY